MNDVLTYVSTIVGLILVYGLLIFAVSYLVSALQAKSDLPDDNDTWAKSDSESKAVGKDVAPAAVDTFEVPELASPALAPSSTAEIPVATVANEYVAPQPNIHQVASDWSGNYVAPAEDVILAYENLAGLEYVPIGFGKSMLIALATATVSSVVVTLLIAIYTIFTFAFQLQATEGPFLVYGVMALSFFGVGLLMRLGFHKAAFGPTALAVAIETLAIFGLLLAAYLWWQ